MSVLVNIFLCIRVVIKEHESFLTLSASDTIQQTIDIFPESLVLRYENNRVKLNRDLPFTISFPDWHHASANIANRWINYCYRDKPVNDELSELYGSLNFAATFYDDAFDMNDDSLVKIWVGEEARRGQDSQTGGAEIVIFDLLTLPFDHHLSAVHSFMQIFCESSVAEDGQESIICTKEGIKDAARHLAKHSREDVFLYYFPLMLYAGSFAICSMLVYLKLFFNVLIIASPTYLFQATCFNRPRQQANNGQNGRRNDRIRNRGALSVCEVFKVCCFTSSSVSALEALFFLVQGSWACRYQLTQLLNLLVTVSVIWWILKRREHPSPAENQRQLQALAGQIVNRLNMQRNGQNLGNRVVVDNVVINNIQDTDERLQQVLQNQDNNGNGNQQIVGVIAIQPMAPSQNGGATSGNMRTQVTAQRTQTANTLSTSHSTTGMSRHGGMATPSLVDQSLDEKRRAFRDQEQQAVVTSMLRNYQIRRKQYDEHMKWLQNRDASLSQEIENLDNDLDADVSVKSNEPADLVKENARLSRRCKMLELENKSLREDQLNLSKLLDTTIEDLKLTKYNSHILFLNSSSSSTVSDRSVLGPMSPLGTETPLTLFSADEAKKVTQNPIFMEKVMPLQVRLMKVHLSYLQSMLRFKKAKES